MKKIYLLLFYALIQLGVNNQSFSQSAVVAAGGQISNGSTIISYSIGQVDYISYSGNGGTVLEGVQQPYDSAKALPVSLLQFNAKATDKKQVEITWVTLSELNEEMFTVERSKDGAVFERLATQKGQGNSVSSHTYQALDTSPFAGLSYYRLKQTDIDGKSVYSDVVPVNITEPETTINAFPNPTTSVLNLKVADASDGQYAFTVCTIDGKQIILQKIATDLTTVNTSSLTKGTYLLNVSKNNDIIKSFKFIKF